MPEWLIQNGGTLLVIGILLFVVSLIVFVLRRDKRAGKSSCGSSCTGCPMAGKCHEERKKK